MELGEGGSSEPSADPGEDADVSDSAPATAAGRRRTGAGRAASARPRRRGGAAPATARKRSIRRTQALPHAATRAAATRAASAAAGGAPEGGAGAAQPTSGGAFTSDLDASRLEACRQL
jgi:hypothetical protein